MVMEMMQLAKFREMVTKVENCRGSVGLYKVKGREVPDFSFSNTGDQSKIPPRSGLQNDMPRTQQRSIELEI